jgi:hypothetical protein
MALDSLVRREPLVFFTVLSFPSLSQCKHIKVGIAMLSQHTKQGKVS